MKLTLGVSCDVALECLFVFKGAEPSRVWGGVWLDRKLDFSLVMSL